MRETTTVERKERRRCASGKPGSEQPVSGLAQELPQSCSSPYLLLLPLHWSAFVCVCVCVCACVDKKVRETQIHPVIAGNVYVHVYMFVSSPSCCLTFLKYSASHPPDAVPV